jgi:hypothetical protein
MVGFVAFDFVMCSPLDETYVMSLWLVMCTFVVSVILFIYFANVANYCVLWDIILGLVFLG